MLSIRNGKKKGFFPGMKPHLGNFLKEHDETTARVKSSMAKDVDKGKDLIGMLKEEVADLKKQCYKYKGQCDI